MPFALNNKNLSIGYFVNKSVLIIYSAAPVSGPVSSQWFWLANSFKRVPFNIPYQYFDAIYHLGKLRNEK